MANLMKKLDNCENLEMKKMLENIGSEMQQQLVDSAGGSEENPLNILGNLDEEASKKLEKHMRKMAMGKLSEGLMDKMITDKSTKKRFKALMKAGSGADD